MTANASVEGRAVVVTGAGNGIGAAFAREAATRGAAAIAVVDINGAAAEAVATELRSPSTTVTAHVVDIGDPNAVEALAATITATHGLPGLVCANAGVLAPPKSLLNMAPSDAQWIVGVNVLGTLYTLQAFGRRMAEGNQPAWLMATGSEHSVGVPHLRGGAYTASKHAVLGMCDVIRGELPDHVGISVLLPGLTTSRLWDATSRRPEHLGGPVDGHRASEAFMASQGMNAAEVARRAFDGMGQGHFLIPTHYNARNYAERRATEMAEAFDHLATFDTTDYDVNRLAAEQP